MLDLYAAVRGTELWWTEFRVSRLAVYDTAGVLIADVRVSVAASPDWADTECGRAILTALMDGPLTQSELSKRAGYKGGRFREVLTGLQAAGRVEKVGPKYKLAVQDLPAGN